MPGICHAHSGRRGAMCSRSGSRSYLDIALMAYAIYWLLNSSASKVERQQGDFAVPAGADALGRVLAQRNLLPFEPYSLARCAGAHRLFRPRIRRLSISSARAAGARSAPSRAHDLRPSKRHRADGARLHGNVQNARAFSSSSSVKWRWTYRPHPGTIVDARVNSRLPKIFLR